MKATTLASRSSFGSKTQISRPVSGSSAITRARGVLTYMRPSTTIGVASNWAVFLVANSGRNSPVWYVQATSSWPTFSRVIWSRDE